MNEPMLTDEDDFTLLPIKRPDLWDLFKTHQKALWIAEEISYASDKPQFDNLSKNEKYFIEHILAFFAGSDGIVMKNINKNFLNNVKWKEAQCFYSIQSYIEVVHSQVYSILIDTYIENPVRKNELFNAISIIPCIGKKANWAIKWMNSNNPFIEKLIAFIIVEGLFFSGSFCAIFWLKSRNIMVSGLGKSNEFISRDEALHCIFGVTLHNYLENKLSEEKIHEIFKEAVEIETEFINESIPCRMIGMNQELMGEYIKYIADFWVVKLKTNKGINCKKIYGASNPFQFMERIALTGKTNFFEQQPTEYSKVTQAFEKFDVADENF